ncbi:MAG TPA: NAD-dependent epimerase/dehydratase family protein [Caulobacteraceae bacterium]|nr:NAD-dependent epimerase/dehydratase family protein [Caulobacteraceae bacterium]
MPEADSKTVLIVGASGVIGEAAVEHFAGLGGWRVIGLSRRRPDVAAETTFEHIAVDLNDPAACWAAADGLGEVTHVVYAALFEKPGLVAGWYEQDQMQTNLAMMKNLMDPLLAKAKGLRHVSVLQGTKAYGAHVHSIAIPARENRPRDAHDNFYWLQEDYIRQAQKAAEQASAGWTFTIWRPQVVFGGAMGVAMNLIPVLGAYAAICRELGRPFVCPTGHENVFEAVDTDLIARALAWAAEAPVARGETYNITNGDVMVWKNVWPAIARAVGLAPAYGAPLSLAEFMPAHADLWDRIVGKHNLRRVPMAALLGESHHYADLLFGWNSEVLPAAMLVSTVKLRQAGFGDCEDTEVMFAKWLTRLVDRGVLPPP